MSGIEDVLLFLGMVAFVSLSGVMAPGPMFATTIAKGYNDLRAGLKISLGHAVIEIPLIAAIFLGFDTVLKNDQVFLAIGLIGGIILLILGADQIRVAPQCPDQEVATELVGEHAAEDQCEVE